MLKRQCRILLLSWVFLLLNSVGTAATPMALPPHPRLLATASGLARLRNNAAASPGNLLARKICRDADAILALPPLGHRMTGNRLLYTARRIQNRIHTLGVAYWLTGERKYAMRAIEQLNIAADFPDWNDRVSFLDAAEMTAACALGYDWFYPLLTPPERRKIATAIADFGLRRALAREHGWIATPGNWNSVCHAAMLAGALAVAEEFPDLAAATVARVRTHLPTSVQRTYSNSGAYPEGPGYWLYGTDYLALALALLQDNFNTDLTIGRQPGIRNTGNYITAMTGSSGQLFNYGDGSPRLECMFALHFLADRYRKPEYLAGPMQGAFRRYIADPPQLGNNREGNLRMLPLALFFLGFRDAELTATGHHSFIAGAAESTPLVILRNINGYLGIKGGSPGVSHGHMDGGAFVYDFARRRWASDIGNDNYEKVEQAGINLWNLAQDSDRWKLFRTGPDSHNILRIDGNVPRADGVARFLSVTPETAELDLSSLYRDTAGQVRRRFELHPNGSVTIRDTLQGLRPGAVVCWQLCTPTQATVAPQGVVLQSGDRKIRVTGNLSGQWEIRPETDFRRQYYAGPAGISMVIGRFQAPESGDLEITIRLIPERPGL